MKGHPDIIETLNRLLTGELTAMDMYFVQSEMFENWGYPKIYARLHHEFDDERRHATGLIRRILFLDGTPDIKNRGAFTIGQGVREMMSEALSAEHEVAKNLNTAIAQCAELGDSGTRELLAALLVDTEGDHILWLQKQIHLIDEVGVENYLQQQM